MAWDKTKPAGTDRIRDSDDYIRANWTALEAVLGGLITGSVSLNNQQFNNLLKNGDFKSWSAGAAAAPDGWTSGGAGVAIAREATIIRFGEYSAKITRNGTDCYLLQTAVTPIDVDTNTYWRGRTITSGCWVYATVASRARLRAYDAVASQYSSYHSGVAGWEFLTVSITINAAATGLFVYLYIATGDTSAYFDGAILVEGPICPAFTPKFLEDHGTVAAEVDETKFSHKLPIKIGGVDYYAMLTTS